MSKGTIVVRKKKVEANEPEEPKMREAAEETEEVTDTEEKLESVDISMVDSKPSKQNPDREDWVKIRIIKNTSAPRIGTFSFSDTYSVSRLEPNQEFMVPPFVGSMMTARKLALATV